MLAQGDAFCDLLCWQPLLGWLHECRAACKSVRKCWMSLQTSPWHPAISWQQRGALCLTDILPSLSTLQKGQSSMGSLPSLGPM